MTDRMGRVAQARIPYGVLKAGKQKAGMLRLDGIDRNILRKPAGAAR